jgi:hypothetical protein
MAPVRQLLGERLVHFSREQEARQQDHDLVALAVLVVDEPLPFEFKASRAHCGAQ